MKSAKSIYRLVAVLGAGMVPVANAATLVVPGQLANANGDISAGFQFNNERIQQAYSRSLFSALAAPAMEINELRFRVEPGTRSFTTTPEVEVRLSTTLQNPDSLNLRFSANTGPDEVVALPRSRIEWSGTPGLSFDVVVPLPNHFVYTPANGHLLVDITMFDLGAQGGSFDAQSSNIDGMSLLVGATSTLTGNIESTGFVTAFTYQAVPEPSTWTLGGIGLIIILKWRKCVTTR
jgi:hypothetical protein